MIYIENKHLNLPYIEDKFIDVNNLWRSKKTEMKEIGEFKNNKRIVTFFISESGFKRNLMGVIKWIGKINDIECAGIELDEPYKFGNSGKLDNLNKFETKSKHGVYTPISNIKIVTKYTSAPIPITVKISKDIDNHSPVKVYRVNSKSQIEKCYGFVVWSGYNDKKEYFYGIKMNIPIDDGTDGVFDFQRLFTCKNKLGLLVPIGMVKKHNTKINSVNEIKNAENILSDNKKCQSIISMLLKFRGDANLVNEEDNTIFDIAYAMSDSIILYSMLNVCESQLNLSAIKFMEGILQELLKLEKFDLLSKIIDNCKVDDNSNKYLLSFCITVLKKTNRNNIFEKIINICTDRNVFLSNGETFLTSLISSDVPVTTIVNVINSGLFDMNKPNIKLETPLVMACRLLMVDVVKILINFNCDIKYNNNKAIEVSVLAKNEALKEQNLSKLDDGSTIIELLSTTNESKDSLLCQICMDKDKNIALNCGHLICSTCENNLYKCPFCFTPISNCLKIYL